MFPIFFLFYFFLNVSEWGYKVDLVVEKGDFKLVLDILCVYVEEPPSHKIKILLLISSMPFNHLFGYILVATLVMVACGVSIAHLL